MEASQLSLNENKRHKKVFTKEEDETIILAVNTYGSRDWNMISTYVKGRTAKQCRDRYMNYLKPGLNNIEWAEKEDTLLINLYFRFGPKWAIISSFFFNRNQISVKNRFRFLQKSNIINKQMFINNNTFKNLSSNRSHNKNKKTKLNPPIQQNDTSNVLINTFDESSKTDEFNFDIFETSEEDNEMFNLESEESFLMFSFL